MSIAVTCDSCGKNLKVPDKFAGKKAKCPKCKGVIRVPGERSSGRMAAAAGKTCPDCGRSMGNDDVFCVGCGLDLRTGKKIQGL